MKHGGPLLAENVSPVAFGEARTKKAARPLTKRLKVAANGQYALRSIYRNRHRIASADAFGIPVIAIEKFGVPQLFYAKENPNAGIAVLQGGLQQARERKDIAYDLAVLLRKEKRNQEAIEAFSICLKEAPESPIACSLHQQRWQLYKAIGDVERAAEDKRLWEVAFNRAYGRHPSPDEIQSTFESVFGPKS
jgi:tetratricopeptide (TPR) repeat protein